MVVLVSNSTPSVAGYCPLKFKVKEKFHWMDEKNCKHFSEKICCPLFFERAVVQRTISTPFYLWCTYRWYNSDEELRAVCVRSCIGHAYCKWSIVSQVSMKLVFKLTTPDRFPSSAITWFTEKIKSYSCSLADFSKKVKSWFGWKRCLFFPQWSSTVQRLTCQF